MVCIYCAGKTKVTNSRPSKRTPGTWRRRQCLRCNTLFTSRETADLSETHVVERTDGSIEPFSRNNLLISVYKSCGHRNTPLEDTEALTDTIISHLLQTTPSPAGLITSEAIITQCQDTLKNFDSVAATYYKAYYS